VSDIETCPTCGTTTITFDPPVALVAQEACGAERPGNHATTCPPRCVLAKGHDGNHMDIFEHTVRWADVPGGGSLTWVSA
jgi:hypothetical protein